MKTFSQKVLGVVKKIKKGEVLTYKEVAHLAGNKRASRAVGNILNKNKDLSIPCYRVIRSDGQIGGYNRGKKNKLIKLSSEGIIFNNRGKICYNNKS